MRNPAPAPGPPGQAPRAPSSEDPRVQTAAVGPSREAPSAVDHPVPVSSRPTADSPAEAEGRRTLSTAFVRVGPDGRLVVELRDGRALVLRNVVMRPQDYCGVIVAGGGASGPYCGSYADVAAARPGAAAVGETPDPAAPNPVQAQ